MSAKGYKKDRLYPSETPIADAGKPLFIDTLNDTFKKMGSSYQPR